MNARRVVAKEVQRMFGGIASGYDRANSVLSLGIHHLWKWRVVADIPDTDGVVLDLCCGTGDLLERIRRRGLNAIGIDFSVPMLDVAKSRGLPVVAGDALSLPLADASISAMTVAFGVRNLEDLSAGLIEMARVLKPGGTLLILEFGQPRWPVIRWLYRFYSVYLVPFLGGLVTGKPDAYRYLDETSRAFPCGQDFCDIVARAGFQVRTSRVFSCGIAYEYRAERIGQQ